MILYVLCIVIIMPSFVVNKQDVKQQVTKTVVDVRNICQ